MQDVGRLGRQGRNFGTVLTGAKLGQQIGLHFCAFVELLHGQHKILARVLAPGIVLIDRVVALHFDVARLQVAAQRDVVHGGVRRGPENVFVFAFFKNTRCTAVVQNQKALHFFGHRCHRQAVARAHVAHHHINFFTLIQVPHFLHLLGGTTRFINVHGFDLQAAKAGFVIRRGGLAFVKGIDQYFCPVDSRYAKALCGLPR